MFYFSIQPYPHTSVFTMQGGGGETELVYSCNFMFQEMVDTVINIWMYMALHLYADFQIPGVITHVISRWICQLFVLCSLLCNFFSSAKLIFKMHNAGVDTGRPSHTIPFGHIFRDDEVYIHTCLYIIYIDHTLHRYSICWCICLI